MRGDLLNLESLLKSKGLRVTKTRLEVLELVDKCNQPVSAEQIFNIGKEKSKNFDLSTIYRNLNILEENNILIKNTDLNGVSFYQVNKKEHKHILKCVVCGKKIIIENCPLDDIKEKFESETDFKILNHNLEFSGICPECLEKEKSKTN